MNLTRIKEICKQKRLRVAELAANIGMSPQNLHRSIRLNQIQAADLEAIARQLRVNVCCFFDNDVLMDSKEEYTNYDERGFTAKNIENVDQRQPQNDGKAQDLELEIIKLQRELLEARTDIIKLLKGSK